MESLDLRVLADALACKRGGHAVTLVTGVETWGSAPRPPGGLLVAGNVEQACALPAVIAYGVTKEEVARLGLPCGGTLRLVQDPLREVSWVETLLARTPECAIA